MWCPGDHHGRAFLHPLQQVPRASTSPGSARWQSPRLQPAGAARPAARAPPCRPAPSDAQGNHRPSHRCPGRTISLASRCRKATSGSEPSCPLTAARTAGKRRTFVEAFPPTVSCPCLTRRVRRSAIRNSQAPSLLTKRFIVRILFGEPIKFHPKNFGQRVYAQGLSTGRCRASTWPIFAKTCRLF
jgi:hypothetical protein